MSDLAEAAHTQTQAFGRRVVIPTCYLGAVFLAMAGWLWAIGWVLVAAVRSLFTG
jgi:hypothetical protein